MIQSIHSILVYNIYRDRILGYIYIHVYIGNQLQ